MLCLAESLDGTVMVANDEDCGLSESFLSSDDETNVAKLPT